MPSPASAPRRLWYLTIDERPDRDHLWNLRGLRAAAARWSRGLSVEERWLGDLPGLSAEQVEREGVFALFLAGTYPEWNSVRSDPAWGALLGRFASLVRQVTTPTLAVCGSHQAVAAAFAGWDAVGHMVPRGSPPARVSDELRMAPPADLIPTPRLGEYGTFPLRKLADDPLLAGLGPLLHVTESHADQVLDDARSPLFAPLLSPARDRPAAALSPLGPAERCPVQALRYLGPGRILYTLAFHPELPAHPALYRPEHASTFAVARALGNDGERLLLNFFDIAEADRVARAGAGQRAPH